MKKLSSLAKRIRKIYKTKNYPIYCTKSNKEINRWKEWVRLKLFKYSAHRKNFKRGESTGLIYLTILRRNISLHSKEKTKKIWIILSFDSQKKSNFNKRKFLSRRSTKRTKTPTTGLFSSRGRTPLRTNPNLKFLIPQL